MFLIDIESATTAINPREATITKRQNDREIFRRRLRNLIRSQFHFCGGDRKKKIVKNHQIQRKSS